jgi:hypothetical protein
MLNDKPGLRDHRSRQHHGVVPRSTAFPPIVDFARDCMNVADVASRTEMLGHGDPLGRDDQRPWRERLLRRMAIRAVNTPVALPFMTWLPNALTSFARLSVSRDV